MTLDDVRDALVAVTTKTYHYWPPDDVTGNYIVWAEDGQGEAQWADDEMQEQTLTGTVDYFTSIEGDPMIASIQAALNSVCAWRLNSVQYEDDTGYIHHEWVFDVG